MKLLSIFFLFLNLSVKAQLNPDEQVCEYPGGTRELIRTIQNNLVYPISAQRDKVTGSCIIKFTVDTLGNPINITVQKSLRGDCDTAAMNAVSYLVGWKPAKYKGQKIPVTLSMPINFHP